jgi:predicted lipoprotein with Yx(FWY)xxD motif
MNRIRTLMVSAAVPVGAIVLVACGSSGYSSSAPPAAAPSSSSAASNGAVLVKTASAGQLGTIVVDAQGMTLYRFDADTNNPPTSNCNGSCATYWPPVMAGSSAPQVQGVSASLLGTVTRSDGSKQITLAGWPLYTYVGDQAPGDAKGQGLDLSGGKWWAVTPTGQKAGSAGSGASSAPSSSGSSSSGGGYGGVQ